MDCDRSLSFMWAPLALEKNSSSRHKPEPSGPSHLVSS